MMIRHNKHFMLDLLNSVKGYMQSYNCTFKESVYDLDHPITFNEVIELSKMMNITLTNDEINKLGRSDEYMIEYIRREEAEYNSVYGD